MTFWKNKHNQKNFLRGAADWVINVGEDDQFDPEPKGGLFGGMDNLWEWDHLASEVSQESQTRVAIVGRNNAGKSTLFNYLQGWQVSDAASKDPSVIRHVPLQAELPLQPNLELFGSFILVDLPETINDSTVQVGYGQVNSGEELLFSLGSPALIVYMLSAEEGVQPNDFQWISLLRSSGRPIVVTMNKCDLVSGWEALLAQEERKLGMSLIPIAARTGENVQDSLLPALLDAAPKLAIPLAREIFDLRPIAARRMIRNASIIAGMTSTQPIPLLDIPFQATIQAGLVMRIAAAYGYTPTGGLSRELVTTILSSLALRYAGQTMLKFVPLFGWIASGVLGASATWLIGETAIRYYENDAKVPFAKVLNKMRGNAKWRPMKQFRKGSFSQDKKAKTPIVFTPPSEKEEDAKEGGEGLENAIPTPQMYEPDYDVPPLIFKPPSQSAPLILEEPTVREFEPDDNGPSFFNTIQNDTKEQEIDETDSQN